MDDKDNVEAMAKAINAEALAADVLIDRATQFRTHARIRFGIIMPSRKAAPTVPTHWRIANMFGVAFRRAEIEDARAWALAALAAGYRPCVAHRNGSGFVPADMERALNGEALRDPPPSFEALRQRVTAQGGPKWADAA